MKTVNTTPYRFIAFDCSSGKDKPAVTLIVKGTFKLRPDQRAEALDENKQQAMRGDEQFMDDLGRSLAYASDLVAIKQRGEVMLQGHCYPGARPRSECDVGMRVGMIDKTLKVSGDRRWNKTQSGMTNPLYFEKMPLRWERAFGALELLDNPLGRGVDKEPDPSGDAWVHAPNIEYPSRVVRDPKDRPPAAGFGPISPNWAPRFGRQGTRDQRWAAFRAPLPPVDFDPRYHNAAPDDQQLEQGTYFRGDETVVLRHMREDLPEYKSTLPRKRLRLFLSLRATETTKKDFVEVEMNLDTVTIDADKEELVLVWRRPITVTAATYPEVEACYIAEEEMASEPLPAEVHYGFYREHSPEEVPAGVAMQAEIDAQMEQAHELLTKGNVDPAVCAQMKQTKDPNAVLDLLMKVAEEKIRELQQLTAQLGG